MVFHGAHGANASCTCFFERRAALDTGVSRSGWFHSSSSASDQINQAPDFHMSSC